MIHFLSHLQHHRVLGELSESVLLRILQKCVIKTVYAREVIFEQGGDDTHLYFIVKGVVKASFKYKDEKISSMYFGEGEGITNVDPASIPVSERLVFEAVTPVTTIYIDQVNFAYLMDEFPDIRKMHIGNYAATLIKYEERVRSLLCHSATDRYLQFMERFGEHISYFTQKDIASYLAITPETLSRLKKNVTDHQGKEVLLEDRE
jgi:CRP-like cAMP-binding protein